MEKKIRNKEVSVKAKLLNIARLQKVDFDSLLLRYMQERFLSRLAASSHADKFVLKGGLLLVSFGIPVLRPTKDMDFLANKVKRDGPLIAHMMAEICALSEDDGIRFDPKSVTWEAIHEDADYEGIRIRISGVLGKARKVLQIDLGFGDTIRPGIVDITFPAILEETGPKVKAYSAESVISEKFEAMIKLSLVNSRMKDFYDVYALSSGRRFNGQVLACAIEATFKARKTSFPDYAIVFSDDFSGNNGRQKQWQAFLKKSKLQGIDDQLGNIMQRITSFLKPVADSIRQGEVFKPVF